MLKKRTSAGKKNMNKGRFIKMRMLRMLKRIVSNISSFFFYKLKERKKEDSLRGVDFSASNIRNIRKMQNIPLFIAFFSADVDADV